MPLVVNLAPPPLQTVKQRIPTRFVETVQDDLAFVGDCEGLGGVFLWQLLQVRPISIDDQEAIQTRSGLQVGYLLTLTRVSLHHCERGSDIGVQVGVDDTS